MSDMITCSCGAQNPASSKFCFKCGTRLDILAAAPAPESAPAPQPTIQVQKPAPAPQAPVPPQPPIRPVHEAPKPLPTTPTSSFHDISSRVDARRLNIPQTGYMVSADETPIVSLQNGYIDNIISGEGLKREDAVITDRRLYYNHSTGILTKTVKEEKVNIEDITGTKILSIRPIFLLILAGLQVLSGIFVMGNSEEAGISLFVCALVFAIVYIFALKKYLRIEYAGGHIDFSLRKYNMDNIRYFQKALHYMKDQYNSKKE